MDMLGMSLRGTQTDALRPAGPEGARGDSRGLRRVSGAREALLKPPLLFT